MQSEKQYIDLYGSCRDMLFSHSADVMNAVRDAAFADFSRQGRHAGAVRSRLRA